MDISYSIYSLSYRLGIMGIKLIDNDCNINYFNVGHKIALCEKRQIMHIILDHQLKEQIQHATSEFPVTYYHDELAVLPDWTGPLHWHTDFEIAMAVKGNLDYQVGQQHIPDPMPNIVFSGTLLAPESSAIYQNYIQPIAQCDSLPFIVFRNGVNFNDNVRNLINDSYQLMKEQKLCYELAVQRNISCIFEFIICNFADLPKSEATRIQISSQVRLQKMLMFIYENYAEEITLEDIAKAADISRSEAGRCFNEYMDCSPVAALIQYRLQKAHQLLNEKGQTLQQISYACGFNSVNYFSRQFKKKYGYSPSKYIDLGK